MTNGTLALPVATRRMSLEQSLQMVTFDIAGQQYGLPLAAVLQVIRLPALLALAGAPPLVCGLLNLRGHYLPVLDGRLLIGEPPRADLSSQIVIVGRAAGDSGQPRLGLLVDQVLDVGLMQAAQFTPLRRGAASETLAGVFNTGQSSVVIFDPDALVNLAPLLDHVA